MKILLVSEYYPPKIFGGGEISARLLAQGLAGKNGVEVTVLTSHSAGLKKEEVRNNVKIVRRLQSGAHPRSLKENLKRMILFSRSVKSSVENIKGFAVVHALNSNSILGVGLAKIKAKKVLTLNSYHGLCPKVNLFYKDEEVCSGCHLTKFIGCMQKSGYIGKQRLSPMLKYNPLFLGWAYWDFLKRNQILKNFHIISISDFMTGRLVREGINRDRITKIYNLFEPNEQSKALPGFKVKGKTVVTFIGSLEKFKGVHVLLDAFKRLKQKQVLLRIVGDGSLHNHLEKIAPDKTLFTGNIDYEYMPYIYKQSDIIVLPSLWPEPFSRILMEATYFGKPIIATSVGGNPEGVINGENGVLVEPCCEGIARGLQRLVSDKVLQEKFGKRSKKLFQERFLQEKLLEKILAVYE